MIRIGTPEAGVTLLAPCWRFAAARLMCSLASPPMISRKLRPLPIKPCAEAINLIGEPACLFIGALRQDRGGRAPGHREAVLRVVSSSASRPWPHPDGYKNTPVEPDSLIGQPFTHQDERHGHARLGLPSDRATCLASRRGPASGSKTLVAPNSRLEHPALTAQWPSRRSRLSTRAGQLSPDR
jgi:hypothetical protein